MDVTQILNFDVNAWGMLAIGAAAGVATAMLVWAVLRSSAVAFDPLRRRLGALRPEEPTPVAALHAAPTRLEALWSRIEPKADAERASLRLQLVQAGVRAPGALGLLYVAKIVLAVLMPGAVLVLSRASPDLFPSTLSLGLAMMAAAYIGVLLPNMYLDRRKAARQDALQRGLPDALDLLVACTEAGLGFHAALDRVTEQLPASYPELAEEFGQVGAEMRAGVDRAQAMRNLSERTGLPDVRALAALITQSGRLGTGIAMTLRVYAEEFRDRRMQAAEARAALVGTKLIFPLVLTLWPAFFVVAVGPAILGAMRVLSETNTPW